MESVIVRIDQREIQRMGGLYTKFPSSFVVCNLLNHAYKVLDVTYGEGRFYKLCRDALDVLVASDPKRWDWIVKPDLFYQFNVFYLYNLLCRERIKFPVRKIDAVVVDPPKWNKNNYNRRKMYNYIIGTPEKIIEYAGKIAKLLSSPYLIVHYDKVLDVENFRPIHVIEFKWYARYLNTKNNNTSFYILYETAT